MMDFFISLIRENLLLVKFLYKNIFVNNFLLPGKIDIKFKYVYYLYTYLNDLF